MKQQHQINNNTLIDNLTEHARKGDETAFAALVKLYAASLYAYVKNLAKNTNVDPEDIVQETFIRAFRKINTYNKKFAFSTWLYAIGRNITIDAIRKNSSENSRNIDSEKNISAYRSVLEEEEKDMIWRIVNNLGKNLQEVIWLRYAQNRSVDEISQITGHTKIYTKVLLYRARNTLAKMITKEVSTEAAEIKKIAVSHGLITEIGGRL